MNERVCVCVCKEIEKGKSYVSVYINARILHILKCGNEIIYIYIYIY